MSLQARIESDLTAAIKAKTEPKRTVLRSLVSAIHNEEIAKGGTLDEAALAGLLRKQVKQREESAAAYQSRPELASQEKAEAEIISVYLPAMLSDDELAKLVDQAIKETGASEMGEMGKVMALLKQKTAGQADSSALAALVKAKLS